MNNIDGFKVKFTEKSHLNPIDDHLSSSIVVNSSEYCQLPSLVLGERGRKRFDSSGNSSSQEFKPGRRTLCAPTKNDESKRGKRYIPPKQYNNDESYFFRNSSFVTPKNSESTDLPAIGWTRKKNIPVESNFQEGPEYSVEDSMGRKQSIQNLHSSMSQSTLRKAEHQSQFFAPGGLIVGSTMKSRQSPVASATHSITKPVSRRVSSDADREEILALTASRKGKQGNVVPSWEERTGCWLVAPEDENF